MYEILFSIIFFTSADEAFLYARVVVWHQSMCVYERAWVFKVGIA